MSTLRGGLYLAIERGKVVATFFTPDERLTAQMAAHGETGQSGYSTSYEISLDDALTFKEQFDKAMAVAKAERGGK